MAYIQERGASILSIVDPDGPLDAALLLRQTVQLVTRRDLPWPRGRCFNVAWRWLTFPLVLPYVLYWDWRFGSK